MIDILSLLLGQVTELHIILSLLYTGPGHRATVIDILSLLLGQVTELCTVKTGV